MFRDPTKEFIQLMKTKSVLWDSKNPDYKDKLKTELAWENISDSTRMSVDVCKKKWKGVRDSYARNIRKRPASDEETYEPVKTYKYNVEMDFLKEQIKPGTTQRVCDQVFGDDYDESQLTTANLIVADDHEQSTFHMSSAEEFIEFIKSRNIIWDQSNPNFKNLKKKGEAWQEVSEAFGIPVDACKKKWKALRDYFQRDLRRNLDESTDCIETNWKYSKQMEFMRHQNSGKKTKNIVGSFIEAIDSDSSSAFAGEYRSIISSTEKLIESVRSKTLLWDITDPDYRHVVKRMKAWNGVSEACGMPVDTCKKKWKSLRDCYLRSLKKTTNTTADSDEPECIWKYKEQMDFLKEQVKPYWRKRHFDSFFEAESFYEATASPNSISEDEQFLLNESSPSSPDFDPLVTMDQPSTSSGLQQMHRENTSICNDEKFLSNTPAMLDFKPEVSTDDHKISSKRLRKRNPSIETTFVSTMESVQQYLSQPRQTVARVATSEPDEDDLFCQSLVKKLKTFPRAAKNYAKVEMLKFLSSIEEQLEEPN